MFFHLQRLALPQVLKQFHAMRADSWQIVDASQPIEAIQQQLRELAAAVVERCRQGQPLLRLWDGAPLQSGGGGSSSGKENGGVNGSA